MRTLIPTLLLLGCSSTEPLPPAAVDDREPPITRPDPWDVNPWVTRDAGAPMPSPALAEAPLAFTFTRAKEPIAEPPPRQLVAAMPARTIMVLAITDDGGAAVTADRSDTARLWPTLDGKHEPVVVKMRPPSVLALSRDGEQLVIGALDAVGQLELVVTKRSGELVRRVAVEAPRRFVTIDAVPRGFVAMTDERALVFVNFDGTPSAPLVADPEQHIVSLAVRGARVLALVESGGELRGRWVELAGAPRWGATTNVLSFAGERVVISPDGRRAAGVARRGKRLVVIDLVDGREVARPLSRDVEDPQLRPIGFTDNNALAYMDESGQLWWWRGGARSDVEDGMSIGALAAGDRHVITAVAAGLSLSSPGKRTQYIAYRMTGPTAVRRSGERLLVSDSMSIVELDAQFHTRTVFELPRAVPSLSGWHGLQIIDEHHVTAVTHTGNGYAMYLIDLRDSSAQLVTKDGFGMVYEPATRLLTYRDHESIRVIEYDAKTGSFGQPAVIELANSTSFTLLDPKIARGNVAVIVRVVDETKAHVELIRAFRFGDADTPYELASEGFVPLTEHWWNTVGDLAKLVDRKLLPSPRIKSPDGRLAAELRDQRITLTNAERNEVWTIPSYGTEALLWTPSGRLIAYGSGIAELDLASGKIGTRQCGWRFGKWSEPPEVPEAAMLCEAP